MIHFNDVKANILDLIKNVKNDMCKYYILRDVFGRISIYIYGDDNIENIRVKAIEVIGNEWVNSIKSINNMDFIFKELVNSTKEVEEDIFYGERQLVKKTWSSTNKSNIDVESKIVTFYSYKGGVGRTTSLVLTALQLVRQGKKVVVVDFDLEAPGVATVLKPENDEYLPKYGTIDFLIESTNYYGENKEIDIDEYIYSVKSKKLTGLLGGELFVMQATKTGYDDCEEYFQKLSRIDFATPQYEKTGNPVELLLKSIDKRYKPDYILIDSRAGIHDIGGIMLTKYAHEVVCIFYGNEQNMFGLNFILPRIIEDEVPFYLINSPVPLSEEEAEEERNIYIKNSYDILERVGYYNDYMPDLLDESAEHFPLDIKYSIEATILNSESRIDTLLNNDGNNNVYYKLAEVLASDTYSSEIIGENIDKKSILNAIDKITPGETPSSENEFNSVEDLRKWFYPLRDHKYIFDNNKFLVIGAKGSGKTALFSVLKYPDYAKALAKYVGIPMQDINKTEWVVGLGMGKEFPGSENFETIGRENDIGFYRKYWQCLAVRRLQNYIEEYIDDIPNVIKQIFSCRYSALKDIINNNTNIAEIISDLLHDLDEQLWTVDKVVILTYDYLDVALTKEYRGDMIAALISLWFENIPRLARIKSKIFLREDIFKFEVKEGITDKAKLNNYTANLGWNYDYLLAMVWKRIVENSDELANIFKSILYKDGYSLPEYEDYIGFVPLPNNESNKIILKEIIGEKMGKGNKAYTYNWIFYRLADTNNKIIPRSILKLFSMAAKNEIADSSRIDTNKMPILRPKSLENSTQEVSTYTLRDLSEEYGEYENIFINMKNYCSSFPADESNFKEALIKCGIEEDNVKTIIDELKEIGFLKEYQRKKSDPIRYHIPDIYLKGMGISRKGYK